MRSENVTLYFTQGSSDKVYNASLEEVSKNGFLVNFAYGRRGATLKTGTKTKVPVDYESAKKLFDKLVKSKTVKGYTPGEEGSQYVHTDNDMRETGVRCQLLNPAEEAQAEQLIQDDAWWAQEKHDGKRMLIRKGDGQGATDSLADTITAINRSGLSVGMPDAILNSANSVDQSYLVDGEAVGETLYVFDLLEIGNRDIRAEPFSQRLAQLENLASRGGPAVFPKGAIVVAETAKTTEEKAMLYARVQESGGEGVVFKQHTAPYTAGRPNSGGTQLKFKFYATASVIVTKINEKQSVGMAALDGDELVAIGNVTIPPNKEIPNLNAIVEVRYLYAYKDGNLYQPTYIGVRDDISLEECVMAQLKYKATPNLDKLE